MPGIFIYCFLRLLLWTAGVAIALFPTLQIAPHLSSWGISSVFAAVNSDGHFRDLFFVIVPASAVSLSTTLDYLCGSLSHGSEVTGLLVIVVLVINVLVLLSGFVGFLLIPVGHTALDPDALSSYSGLITVGLVLSLITELWVSGAGERRRRGLHSRNSKAGSALPVS